MVDGVAAEMNPRMGPLFLGVIAAETVGWPHG
jgi:hypothetical protein